MTLHHEITPDLGSILDELHTFPVLFVHAGSLFCPDLVEASVLAGLKSRGLEPMLIDADEPASDIGGARALVIRGLDRVASSADRCTLLARLRSWAMQHASAGVRMVVLSHVPKLRLSGCPGSQLILDARTVFLTCPDDTQVAEALTKTGLDPGQRRHVEELASGRPGLVKALVDAAKTFGEAAEASAEKRQRAIGVLRNALTASVSEAGWEVASYLDRLLFEEQTDRIDCNATAPLIREALRGTGLATQESDHEMVILSSRLLPLLREAVRETVDRLFTPPAAVSETIIGLWEIERRLRRVIQEAAIARHSANWRQHVIGGDIERRVKERATAETLQIVDKITDLGNPLEWLTLEELLAIVNEPEGLDAQGYPRSYWRRISSELIPVRNRLAHTRLPAPGDADVVTKWRGGLRRRQE